MANFLLILYNKKMLKLFFFYIKKLLRLNKKSFVFKVLPRVKIALAFWRGDQEFSSKISLMFDKNITHYLPLEDISVVCQELAIRLTLKNKKSNKKV